MCSTTPKTKAASTAIQDASGIPDKSTTQPLHEAVTKDDDSFDNPLNDAAQATILLQTKPSGTTAAEFNKQRKYRIFVPRKLATSFKNAPTGSKPKAKVSLFFGVGPEMFLFKLRKFFQDSEDGVFITIPGVEGGWEGIPIPFGYGISTNIIKALLESAGFGGMEFTIEVIAAYSTGYRGVNLTVINELVDLTKLKRLIYLDAWYHHDDHPKMPSGPYAGKNTKFSIDTAFQKNPDVDLIIYAFTHPGGVPRSNPSQTNQAVPNSPKVPVQPLITQYGSHIHFIDFEFKFGTKPPIDDALEKICLARLIQFGIGDSKFPESSLSPAIKGLVDILPARGSLGTLGISGYVDLYSWVATHAPPIASFSIPSAMTLVTANSLLGSWTTNSHYEMRHRMFVIELGKEPLLPS
jgi:hypothetical protein